jgi:glycosyltransferase involved in cell wall biosynthesis
MISGVSVIICCYNSARRLPITLQRLASQEINKSIPWEIVVVDNASTDNTVQLVREAITIQDFKCPLRIVHEINPGLANARKKGIDKSRYEYLIFCDDDNWLSPNYISGAYKILDENPSCGIAGSKILPAFEIEKPCWFDSYEMYYSVGERSVTVGDITDSVGSVLGAGMITRKSIWQKIFQTNYKFLCTDRQGNVLSTGGDIEMCTIVRELDFRIYYSNEIYLEHFIPKERLTIDYLKRNAFGVGMFYSLIQPYYYLATKRDANKASWMKDVIYNITQLWRPFIPLLEFKRLAFIIAFKLSMGKICGLLSLRGTYLKKIQYIQSYYASRN